MGEVADIFAELKRDNPSSRDVDLRVIADALAVYCEAADNVRRNGAIVLHPRTGAPMENPYLKIQTAFGAILTRARRVKVDRVMRLVESSQGVKGSE